MKVLIVDDSKAVHSYTKALFADGMEFVSAFDGEEATEFLKSDSVDLILLDWEMPKINGLEALKSIRAGGDNTPIIMVTSKNIMANIIEAMDNGANEYIMKPFTKEILVEKMSEVLGRKVA